MGLVTADAAAGLDPDLPALAASCRRRLGVDAVHIVSWDDGAVDWARFDAVVIRSTWDYAERVDAFRTWIDHVDGVTRLVNGADAVRWNLDKRYLRDLEEHGVPIVPTTFVAPGDDPPDVTGLHVVKPAIGAGSNGARRCEASGVADQVATLHAAGRTAMVQPYLDRLDAEGETGYCFVPAAAGPQLELSHVFGKGAILTSRDVEQEGGLFAKEQIGPGSADPAELTIAQAALATDVVASFADVAYARVDIVPYRDDDGSEFPVVMELELIEPSFFLHTAKGSAERLADRLVSWLERSGTLEGAH